MIPAETQTQVAPTICKGGSLTSCLVLFVLLAVQALLGTGCTAALWKKETFACRYHPADPNQLRLFQSIERKDILVQYDEARDKDKEVQTRCYWLEPNTVRVNREQKPHFVSPRKAEDLTSIPVTENPPRPAPSGLRGLSAVALRDDDYFTLYSGQEQLEAYRLPTYPGASQKVKQVLLTPFALAVDATIVGAVISYYAAPQFFLSWNR